MFLLYFDLYAYMDPVIWFNKILFYIFFIFLHALIIMLFVRQKLTTAYVRMLVVFNPHGCRLLN